MVRRKVLRVERILGENQLLIVDLRCLRIVDRLGHGLINRLGHGLIDRHGYGLRNRLGHIADGRLLVARKDLMHR